MPGLRSACIREHAHVRHVSGTDLLRNGAAKRPSPEGNKARREDVVNRRAPGRIEANPARQLCSARTANNGKGKQGTQMRQACLSLLVRGGFGQVGGGGLGQMYCRFRRSRDSVDQHLERFEKLWGVVDQIWRRPNLEEGSPEIGMVSPNWGGIDQIRDTLGKTQPKLGKRQRKLHKSWTKCSAKFGGFYHNEGGFDLICGRFEQCCGGSNQIRQPIRPKRDTFRRKLLQAGLKVRPNLGGLDQIWGGIVATIDRKVRPENGRSELGFERSSVLLSPSLALVLTRARKVDMIWAKFTSTKASLHRGNAGGSRNPGMRTSGGVLSGKSSLADSAAHPTLRRSQVSMVWRRAPPAKRPFRRTKLRCSKLFP